MSASLCEDCVKCVTHEGTPEGTWETINGIECYVGAPSSSEFEFKKDKVLLYLCDAFGPALINNQLLVDDFARNGIKTIAPGVFDKDHVPADYEVSEERRKNFDLPAWISRHGVKDIRSIIDKVVDGLKSEGVTEFAAIGYCFGGRGVFNLAFDNVISLSIANHPSFLKIPEDLEKYFSASRAPLLLNTCTIDVQFPHEAQAIADGMFGQGKFAPGYRREYFEDCTHGFAVRGDLSDPKVKAGKEGAFKSSVDWLFKYGFGPTKKSL